MRKDTKPDTSILVKTGHFYFGLTKAKGIIDINGGNSVTYKITSVA